ncbi:unnamed protein product [Angiostrongylus costaricensis]|uniref:Regulatory protein zeste n=1 Tax=Angiostrongylus costaricensis TaxID=334426 RepID=A0A158PMC9_ANGCS|nr:unnamed protein product [Angiostrongylus costaricensis]
MGQFGGIISVENVKMHKNHSLVFTNELNSFIEDGGFSKNPGVISEEQKNEAWSRILAECAARGHHWVKGKDVTYLKKSKWPGIKRDAIEHYQSDMRGDVSHRKKLTEADVIVLKAISFDTENLGSFSEKDSTARAAVSEQRDSNVTQPVTVEVKTGRPLDFLGCGMALTDEVDKFDNGLLFSLFPKNQQESKKTTICAADQEQRYTKRQRVDDDGPIDHDLMAALGFGKNRQKRVDNSIIPGQVRKSTERDHGDPHHLTTVGDYLRSVTSLSSSMKDANTVAMPSAVTMPQPMKVPSPMGVPSPVTMPQPIKVPSPMTMPSPMAMHSPNVTDRVPSMENQKSVMSLQKVAPFNSTPIMPPPKEICRDLKNLQKKAIESQIARDDTMTKYYQMKMRKLELEIALLQRSRTENQGFCRKLRTLAKFVEKVAQKGAELCIIRPCINSVVRTLELRNDAFSLDLETVSAVIMSSTDDESYQI